MGKGDSKSSSSNQTETNTYSSTHIEEVSAEVIDSAGNIITDAVDSMTNAINTQAGYTLDNNTNAFELVGETTGQALELAEYGFSELSKMAIESGQRSENLASEAIDASENANARIIDYAILNNQNLADSFSDGLSIIANNDLGVSSSPNAKYYATLGVLAGLGGLLIFNLKK